MNTPSTRSRSIGALAAVIVGFASASAWAGITMPDVTIEIKVFSKDDTTTPIYDQTHQPAGSPFGPPGNFAWTYDVNVSNSIFAASGLVNASPVTSPVPAFLNPAIDFTNNSGESLWFNIRVAMPVAETFGLPLSWSSSAGFGVVGPNSQLETLPGTPLWTVGVDNNALGSAFPDPTILNINNQTVSDNLGGSINDPVTGFMFVDFAFKLTPDSVGGPSGNFFITSLPAPGALALLGFAGLIGVSSRRRNAN